jgi:hypothetical protein
MDALDESCFWGSCVAGRGRASPSEIPRRDVELYDQSGGAWSPLAQSKAPACPGMKEFLFIRVLPWNLTMFDLPYILRTRC